MGKSNERLSAEALVKSVAGVKPDETGNVEVTSANIDVAAPDVAFDPTGSIFGADVTDVDKALRKIEQTYQPIDTSPPPVEESPDLPNGTPLQHNKPWLVDTSTPRNRPLPTNPSSGDIVTVRDDAGMISVDGVLTNKITIEYSDVPIMGLTENLEITVNWSWVKLQYIENRNDWRVIGGGVGGQVKFIPEDIANALYPVGHVIMSFNANNPGSYLQFGLWQALPGGLVLATAGTSTDINSLTKDIQPRSNEGEWAHTQTKEELANHSHILEVNNNSNRTSGMGGSSAQDDGKVLATTSAVGSNAPMNIANPMCGVFVWERIA